MSDDWPHAVAGAGCMAAKGEEASMVAVGGGGSREDIGSCWIFGRWVECKDCWLQQTSEDV